MHAFVQLPYQNQSSCCGVHGLSQKPGSSPPSCTAGQELMKILCDWETLGYAGLTDLLAQTAVPTSTFTGSWGSDGLSRFIFNARPCTDVLQSFENWRRLPKKLSYSCSVYLSHFVRVPSHIFSAAWSQLPTRKTDLNIRQEKLLKVSVPLGLSKFSVG